MNYLLCVYAHQQEYKKKALSRISYLVDYLPDVWMMWYVFGIRWIQAKKKTFLCDLWHTYCQQILFHLFDWQLVLGVFMIRAVFIGVPHLCTTICLIKRHFYVVAKQFFFSPFLSITYKLLIIYSLKMSSLYFMRSKPSSSVFVFHCGAWFLPYL